MMKTKLIKILAISALFLSCGSYVSSCSDDKEDSPVETGGFGELPESKDLPFSYENDSRTISFSANGSWKTELEGNVDWVYFSPATGKKGKNTVKVTVAQNTSSSAREAKFNLVSGSEKVAFTVRQPEFGGVLPEIGAGEKGTVDPAEIPDYDKFFANSEWGRNILQKSAKFSFARYKSSEHFFVFWAPEFGEDPNASTVPANMRVDIDDLLAKAEKFFETNINKLGMSELGQGRSTLDKYKMQIYLLYQDEWLATGSGYDDMIGALWINPSTCQPVGSTIAHEIGHSFQYQTYADRVQTQGVANDYSTGFRYGFVGPDGSGNGGCGYWEQCAQWQAQRDYPEEQFTTYNFDVWLKNCHRHFHHEFQRYASYWLQSYWVEKHGVEAYGRIWKESCQPEDAIMTYTRLYNNGDYSKTREELFDYAMRMATFDIKDVREYANGYQNLYNPTFIKNENGEYQVAYSSCPGATGFNVIPLTVPSGGGKVTVKFNGLGYGDPLAANDNSQMVNGDGVAQGKPSAYNAVGGAENMGWRYGFVAVSGETRTYGDVGKDAKGNLSFNVPASTDYLYLVVQGSPESYMSHGWDELEKNDPQFPYAISLEGTSLLNYKEPLKATYKEENGVLTGTLSIVANAATDSYEVDKYDLGEKTVADFFGISVEEVGSLMVVPENGKKQAAAEGKIVVFNQQSDGTLSDLPTANAGYWIDSKGDAVGWGNGQVVFFEVGNSVMTFGKMPGGVKKGEKYEIHPVFVYTENGVAKTVRFNVTFDFSL